MMHIFHEKPYKLSRLECNFNKGIILYIKMHFIYCAFILIFCIYQSS